MDIKASALKTKSQVKGVYKSNNTVDIDAVETIKEQLLSELKMRRLWGLVPLISVGLAFFIGSGIIEFIVDFLPITRLLFTGTVIIILIYSIYSFHSTTSKMKMIKLATEEYIRELKK